MKTDDRPHLAWGLQVLHLCTKLMTSCLLDLVTDEMASSMEMLKRNL